MIVRRVSMADALRARGKLGPYTTPAPKPALVRAWAAERGIPCPKHGPVPTEVVAAYLEAQ
jgi:hypothetical protein